MKEWNSTPLATSSAQSRCDSVLPSGRDSVWLAVGKARGRLTTEANVHVGAA